MVMGMLLDNIFVKKAIKSMLTEQQFMAIQNFMTAVQNGKIDKTRLKRVGDKVSKMSPEEIDNVIELIDENVK
jgi:hypothetical protein